MKVLRLAVVTAVRALRRNKLRSGLTILGVVIGVAAVIAMAGLGLGASEAVQQQIRSLGNNMLFVHPGSKTDSGVRSGAGSVSTLTTQDADAIAAEVNGVAAVTYVRREVAQLVYANGNWSTLVQGVTPAYQEIASAVVARGAFFGEREERAALRVAVLGATVVDELFRGGEDPIGATVRIRQVPFRIIGVLEARGRTAWGTDQDDVVLIPFATAERRVMGTPLPGRVELILVSALDDDGIGEVERGIERVLRDRHRIRAGEEDDFSVGTLDEIAETARGTTRIMATVLFGVSSISLLVGGIGIMNILLVSVTERTREIGIRVALGAKRRHIRTQFLVESVVLSSIGGAIGVVVGLALTVLLSRLGGWPAYLSPGASVGAVAFSAGVGVFFGFYPAHKASRLDPIVALRYE